MFLWSYAQDSVCQSRSAELLAGMKAWDQHTGRSTNTPHPK